MKKSKLMIIIFLVNAVYMILELIASRVLSPYCGSSNLVWTSVIGIILLSSSVGNYIGGIIADKGELKKNIKIILLMSVMFILFILIAQTPLLSLISKIISNIKAGAIFSTVILFFIPSMFIGFLSPIMIKLSLEDIEDAGKVSGKVYAVGTLGGIAGTFLGGFYLLPMLGNRASLLLLATIMCILIFLVDEVKNKKWLKYFIIVMIALIGILGSILINKLNYIKSARVKEGDVGITVEYDTEYGKVNITNYYTKSEPIRLFSVDKGNETVAYTREENKYELFSEYTKCYNLMFKSSKEIKDVLMIGGAGYAYPKYYISHYEDKNMDVVEIDGKVTDLAREYFFLDDLIEEYNIKNNNRLNIITEDGRTYLNKEAKKYDAILNDAFSGSSPAVTLTTIEAVEKIYNSLEEGGVYLTNIISSLDGKDSKFVKAEVNTISQVFKNVYVIPVTTFEEDKVQNIMVIASDEKLNLDKVYNLNIKPNEIIITDNLCPVDNLIPII